jgi:hypothetical protein
MKNPSVAVRLRFVGKGCGSNRNFCKLLLLLSNWSKVAVPPLRSLRFSELPGFPHGCGSVAERAVHPHTPIRLWGVLVGTPRLFLTPTAAAARAAKPSQASPQPSLPSHATRRLAMSRK